MKTPGKAISVARFETWTCEHKLGFATSGADSAKLAAREGPVRYGALPKHTEYQNLYIIHSTYYR